MSATRQELKKQAKELIRRHYWPAVGMGLLAAMTTGAMASGSGSRQYATDPQGFTSLDPRIASWSYFVLAVIVLISIAISIFVMNPLEAGAQAWFLRVQTEDGSEKGSIRNAYSHENYMRNVETIFFRDLFICLWSLLLVVPGIIKAYEYYFVPFLLADHPDMSGTDILNLSREMTAGRKFDLFVLDLSFILWFLLAAVTFNLSGIFYSFPYMFETRALMYADLVRDGADRTRPAAQA